MISVVASDIARMMGCSKTKSGRSMPKEYSTMASHKREEVREELLFL